VALIRRTRGDAIRLLFQGINPKYHSFFDVGATLNADDNPLWFYEHQQRSLYGYCQQMLLREDLMQNRPGLPGIM
jgi:hypothetical protein